MLTQTVFTGMCPSLSRIDSIIDTTSLIYIYIYIYSFPTNKKNEIAGWNPSNEEGVEVYYNHLF